MWGPGARSLSKLPDDFNAEHTTRTQNHWSSKELIIIPIQTDDMRINRITDNYGRHTLFTSEADRLHHTPLEDMEGRGNFPPDITTFIFTTYSR